MDEEGCNPGRSGPRAAPSHTLRIVALC